MEIEVISTVTVPASTYDLTDIDTVKKELGESSTKDDDFLSRSITSESAKVAQYCNRVFPLETLVDTFYIRRGAYPWRPPGKPDPLRLSRWPVTSVTSVIQTQDDGTTVTMVADTDYKRDDPHGWLYRLDSDLRLAPRWEPFPVAVTYQAGYASVPVDVAEAAIRLVTARFAARKRDPLLKVQDQPGVGRQEYWIGAPPMQGNMPAEIAAILDNYRVPLT